MRRKLIFGIILFLLFTNLVTIGLWLWSGDQETSEEFTVEVDPKEPVAEVNGDSITYRQWIGYMENEYGKNALEELINEQVVSELANEANVSINDGVLALELSLLATMEGVLSEDAIEKKEAKWTEEVTNRLYYEELITQDVEVSEQEIQHYYESYNGQYHFSPSIQLSHVIVEDEATAEKVIEELEAGASFASLAREYTLDEETREDGGYLGFYTSSSSFLPTDYYEQAQQMNEHTYSEPFQTTEGVAIIYLHRFLPEIDLSYEQLHDHIRREIALEKMERTPSASTLWDELDVQWIYD